MVENGYGRWTRAAGSADLMYGTVPLRTFVAHLSKF